ncbi:MAG: glycosyltransferase [Lewinellaceae bacterium]|nr:glycosyltransferase [Lewinellaceae bacterium]
MALPRQPNPVDVSVIIVNYNVRYFLEQALLAVRKASQGLSVEVWVVDNQSADDSVAMVREKFPEVNLIANSRNVGFSQANNQAIRAAGGRYVLLLNPDTVIEEKTLLQCLTFMDEHPEAGGLGVRMIDGAGVFLPESKRGFPAPFVAFCKAFGLSRLFPRSRLFNRYHLGFLDEDQTHPVDVLSGAFMWLRHSVLTEIGLLDEQFFMYGEDIDLSYRIKQAGFENYYYPATTIIHYKGESTRKGSLNYVRVFYQAMILFAQKHFAGPKKRLLVLMMQVAVYFRALLTLAATVFRQGRLPLLDAFMLFAGIAFLRNFWARYRYSDPEYYSDTVLTVNAPLYVGIWLIALFFSGAYDRGTQPRQAIRGILWGTLGIAAIYGFLDSAFRNSRALILLGAAWGILGTLALRWLSQGVFQRNWRWGEERSRRIALVGTAEECLRAQNLIQRTQIPGKILGWIAPQETTGLDASFFGVLPQLADLISLYQIDEVIFCSRDISYVKTIRWMNRLGPSVHYKLLPEGSNSIIGSHSKDESGELYTLASHFRIGRPEQIRTKRLFDLAVVLVLLLGGWIFLLVKGLPVGWWLREAIAVLRGKKSWVGYYEPAMSGPADQLPRLRPGVLTLAAGYGNTFFPQLTLQQLNVQYAQDYSPRWDWQIIRRELFKAK